MGIYHLEKELCGIKQAVITIALCLLFTPYWVYLPIAYTDLLSMPFFVFPLLLFVKYKLDEKSWVTLLLASVLAGIGYQFKGTPIIVIMAIGIWIFLSDSAWQRKIRDLFIIIIGSIVTIVLLGMLIPKISLCTPEEISVEKTPISYWIWTGLTSEGGWGEGSWNSEVVEQIKLRGETNGSLTGNKRVFE